MLLRVRTASQEGSRATGCTSLCYIIDSLFCPTQIFCGPQLLFQFSVSQGPRVYVSMLQVLTVFVKGAGSCYHMVAKEGRI